MTKADLVEKVAKQAEMTKKDAEKLVEIIFESIVSTLNQGEKIELRGFGSFRVRERNARKAARLYAAIDGSGGYYRSPVDPADRSLMNVVFRLPDEDAEDRFLAEAEQGHLLNLKGHRSVGGMRASLYNAMPMSGVEALASFMDSFR